MQDQSELVALMDRLKNQQGWNDRELAKELKTGHSLVSQWRNGKRTMSVKTMHKIRELVKCFQVDQKEKAGFSKSIPTDHFFQVIAEAWPDLNIDERSRLAAQAATMIADKSKKAATAG